MDLDILAYEDSRTLRKKRGEILEAAANLFIDKGIDRISMQMIAEASSITRRSLYNYYESKEKIAVDIKILYMRDVDFFNTWNILGATAEKVRSIIQYILENQLKEYMFMSCFNIYFSKGYPDKRYVDFLNQEISGLNYGENPSHEEYAVVELLLAYTYRLIIRMVRESLSYSDVREEVELICSLLI